MSDDDIDSHMSTSGNGQQVVVIGTSTRLFLSPFPSPCPMSPSSSHESSDSQIHESVLSRLRSPVPSDLCRKRSIATNSTKKRSGKAKRSSSSSSSSSITPHQRIQEFPRECLRVSVGKLFCNACREELSLKKSSILNHVSSSKHSAGKERIARKEKREMDIAAALKRYDAAVHPSGEFLSESTRVYRVKVVSTFLKAGAPLSKIDDFRELLEDGGTRLAGRKPMSDIVPFILNEERQRIKQEIEGLPVSVIFDGTTRLGEALAVILRFVDSSSITICQRLIRLQLLVKSMSGEETARELLSALSTEYAIASSNLLAAIRMHDHASVNTVAMQTVKVLYPSVLDIGCFSHTIDHVGEHFSAPTLHDFGILWVSLFSRSPKARVMWKTRTGRSMLSYSQTRWWSRWEVYNQLLALFGDVLPFLEENSDISTATRTKLIALMRDPTKYTLLNSN